MKIARCLCWAVTLAALSPTAQALEFEVTPFAGYRFGGQFEDPTTAEDVDIKEAASYGLAFDVEYAPNQAFELFYSRQSTEVEDTAPVLDVDVEYLMLGGVGSFPTDNNELLPFLTGSLGAARYSPDGDLDEETRFALGLGGGIKYFFRDNLGLRFEGRGYVTFFDSDSNIFCISDQTGATCRLRSKGSAVWQIEAQAGFIFRF